MKFIKAILLSITLATCSFPVISFADTIVQNNLIVGGTTPNTRYWSANGVNFIPLGPSATYSRLGAGLSNTSASYQWFVAPVNIPHGASINEIMFCYTDTDLTTRIELDMIWLPQTSNYGSTMGNVNSTTSSSVACKSATLTPAHVVDNSSNTYILQVGLQPTTHTFVSVRVSYSLSDPLP